MSELLEPGAVYRALQEVQDGSDPADVYQRLIGESIDPEEAIQDDFFDQVEAAHDFGECREKSLTVGICYGFTCVHVEGGRLLTDCPCACHKDEEL